MHCGFWSVFKRPDPVWTEVTVTVIHLADLLRRCDQISSALTSLSFTWLTCMRTIWVFWYVVLAVTSLQHHEGVVSSSSGETLADKEQNKVEKPFVGFGKAGSSTVRDRLLDIKTASFEQPPPKRGHGGESAAVEVLDVPQTQQSQDGVLWKLWGTLDREYTAEHAVASEPPIRHSMARNGQMDHRPPEAIQYQNAVSQEEKRLGMAGTDRKCKEGPWQRRAKCRAMRASHSSGHERLAEAANFRQSGAPAKAGGFAVWLGIILRSVVAGTLTSSPGGWTAPSIASAAWNVQSYEHQLRGEATAWACCPAGTSKARARKVASSAQQVRVGMEQVCITNDGCLFATNQGKGGYPRSLRDVGAAMDATTRGNLAGTSETNSCRGPQIQGRGYRKHGHRRSHGKCRCHADGARTSQGATCRAGGKGWRDETSSGESACCCRTGETRQRSIAHSKAQRRSNQCRRRRCGSASETRGYGPSISLCPSRKGPHRQIPNAIVMDHSVTFAADYVSPMMAQMLAISLEFQVAMDEEYEMQMSSWRDPRLISLSSLACDEPPAVHYTTMGRSSNSDISPEEQQCTVADVDEDACLEVLYRPRSSLETAKPWIAVW